MPSGFRDPTEPRVIEVAIFPGFQPLDAVGPFDAFTGANRWLEDHDRPPHYRVELVAEAEGLVEGEGGLTLWAQRGFTDAALDGDTMIVVGGSGIAEAIDKGPLVEWLVQGSHQARRVASVCTGTFALAEAGLCDGKAVTTHWAYADLLADRYPSVTVDPDPVYIQSGAIWTSAGVTAGIDLALAMIEADLGATIAQSIARRLVMFLRRPGGQSQFSAPVWSDCPERDAIRVACERVQADPSADLTVAILAAGANMSERHFQRTFLAEVGCTPGRYVERVRIEAARRRLESSREGVRAVARACGFGTSETMRRAFVRNIGVAPTEYRKRFALIRPQREKEEL